MVKRIFTLTPQKMHQNASFSYSKYKKIFSGEGHNPSPHPTPLDASILAPSVLDVTPEKKSWKGPCNVLLEITDHSHLEPICVCGGYRRLAIASSLSDVTSMGTIPIDDDFNCTNSRHRLSRRSIGSRDDESCIHRDEI
jgi:hypothetical protein